MNHIIKPQPFINLDMIEPQNSQLYIIITQIHIQYYLQIIPHIKIQLNSIELLFHVFFLIFFDLNIEFSFFYLLHIKYRFSLFFYLLYLSHYFSHQLYFLVLIYIFLNGYFYFYFFLMTLNFSYHIVFFFLLHLTQIFILRFLFYIICHFMQNLFLFLYLIIKSYFMQKSFFLQNFIQYFLMLVLLFNLYKALLFKIHLLIMFNQFNFSIMNDYLDFIKDSLNLNYLTLQMTFCIILKLIMDNRYYVVIIDSIWFIIFTVQQRVDFIYVFWIMCPFQLALQQNVVLVNLNLYYFQVEDYYIFLLLNFRRYFEIIFFNFQVFIFFILRISFIIQLIQQFCIATEVNFVIDQFSEYMYFQADVLNFGNISLKTRCDVCFRYDDYVQNGQVEQIDELLGMAYEVLNDAIFDLKCRLYFEEFFGEQFAELGDLDYFGIQDLINGLDFIKFHIYFNEYNNIVLIWRIDNKQYDGNDGGMMKEKYDEKVRLSTFNNILNINI